MRRPRADALVGNFGLVVVLGAAGCGGTTLGVTGTQQPDLTEGMTFSGHVNGTLTQGMSAFPPQKHQVTADPAAPYRHTLCDDYVGDAGAGQKYHQVDAAIFGSVAGHPVQVLLGVNVDGVAGKPWVGKHGTSLIGYPDGLVDVWVLDNSGLRLERTDTGGSFTVSPDGRSGVIDTSLQDGGGGHQASATSRLKGTWRC